MRPGMRSIPNRFDPIATEPPTRPAQNWQWRRREPAPAKCAVEAQGHDARPSCVTTVVLPGAILDFEAYAVVVGSERHFLPVQLFWIAAALLFAEGEEVPTTYLASIHRGPSAPNSVHWVSREVRQLRCKVLSSEAGLLVSGTGRGYRLDRLNRSA